MRRRVSCGDEGWTLLESSIPASQICKTGAQRNTWRGMGVFTKEALARDSFVIEYAGEVISEDECDRRLSCDYSGEKHKYLMVLCNGVVIDATRRGNYARFVNHSCEPSYCVQNGVQMGYR